MRAEHHTLTIDATYELLDFWRDNKTNPNIKNLGNITKIIRARRKDMGRWAAQADDLEDIKLPPQLTEVIAAIIKISGNNLTRFQHFAYCDSDEHEGYCWDRDPSVPGVFKWRANRTLIKNLRSLIPVARINGKIKLLPIGSVRKIQKYIDAKVKYQFDWCPLSEDFFKRSYGYKDIKGNIAWHDQKYPSAVEMAEFYGDGVANLAKQGGNLCGAIQSLSFAIHMLQDLGVYHHVYGKLFDGHWEFEDEALKLWKEYYAREKNTGNIQELKEKIGKAVIKSLKEIEKNGPVDSFEELGRRLVAITGKQFQGIDTFHKVKKNENEKKAMAIEMTVQGIACTIKAINLFV